MLRDYISVTLGVLTLLIASGAVYGILTLNTEIQANPEQIKIPDYSSELDSLKSQVNSISNNLSTLDNLNANVADIHTKLTELTTLESNITDIQQRLANLENKNNQIQQVSSVSEKLTIVLAKSTYFSGDTIHIAAIGATPQKLVQVELLDSNGSILINQNTWADSTGTVMYDLKLSSSILPGNYQVKLVSDQQTDLQPIIIQSQTTSTGTLTAQTDKTIYQTGDFIQISGMAQPSTGVIAVMTSPSGKTFSTGTTANADGSYTMFFSTSQSFETGNWYVTMTNLAQTKVIYFTMNLGSSTSSYTLTAQTDKTIYQTGQSISVSGTAQPNTSVTAILSSPSGKTYNSATTANADGSYILSLSPSSPYETGNWYITVSNLAQSRVVSIYIQS